MSTDAAPWAAFAALSDVDRRGGARRRRLRPVSVAVAPTGLAPDRRCTTLRSGSPSPSVTTWVQVYVSRFLGSCRGWGCRGLVSLGVLAGEVARVVALGVEHLDDQGGGASRSGLGDREGVCHRVVRRVPGVTLAVLSTLMSGRAVRPGTSPAGIDNASMKKACSSCRSRRSCRRCGRRCRTSPRSNQRPVASGPTGRSP